MFATLRSFAVRLAARQASSSTRRLRTQLRVEALEAREVPTGNTYQVTTLNDTHRAAGNAGYGGRDSAGNISLRSAIEDANMVGPADISFAPGLTGTIWLTQNSELELSKNISINGGGNIAVAPPNGTNIQFRIFEVDPSKTCELTGLELFDGYEQDGGAIMNSGIVTATGLYIHDNYAETNGGGIYNQQGATLNISGGTITLNRVGSIAPNAGMSRGGGIYNNGTLRIMANAFITYNTATGGLGGGIYNYTSGNAQIYASSINNNNALTSVFVNGSGFGGGVYNAGTITLTTCSLNINYAQDLGGGLYTSGTATLSTVSVGWNKADGDAGGFCLVDGTLNFQNQCSLSNNTGKGGANGGLITGGVFNDDGSNIEPDNIVRA